MTINWRHAEKEPPADNQMCFITAASEGFQTFPIIGPIGYKSEPKMFIDLFATPEAGAAYNVGEEGNADFWWCDESEINLPGEKQ